MLEGEAAHPGWALEHPGRTARWGEGGDDDFGVARSGRCVDLLSPLRRTIVSRCNTSSINDEVLGVVKQAPMQFSFVRSMASRYVITSLALWRIFVKTHALETEGDAAFIQKKKRCVLY